MSAHDDESDESTEGLPPGEEHHHHILPTHTGIGILVALLIFTIITVAASRIDFGMLNFPIAMAIASVKALLVVLFFMGLKYDSNENRIIFFSSLAFVAAFFVLTAADLFTRGDVRVKGPVFDESAVATGKPKFNKPWVEQPALVQHGKEIFESSCVVCHGAQGMGDGPGSVALNPKPRNFHAADGWKNGRQPSRIFSTLTAGLNNIMPSFSTLPPEDRWSLAWYVLSFGPPEYKKDTPGDLLKLGIQNPEADDGGMPSSVKKTIPIDFAMERYLDSAQK